jgi:hypothetical protein
LAASACSDGDDDPDANVQIDSGSTDDASTVDGAPVDAPTMDARATDALAYDAQTYDGPFPDAFPIDATVPDAAFPDAFPPDAMLPDAMPPDAMVPAFCGDGTCNEGECNSCFADCPDGCFCPHDECTEGVALDALCGECTTQICAVDSFCCQTAWDGACVNEVETVCNKQCPSVCGDFVCDVDEDCSTCENDCGVCQVCGDNQCVGAECSTCPADCPNGCNCPHDECTEGAALDEGCSACVEDICAQDPFCCQTAWDGLCVSEVSTICGNTCP